MNDKIINLHNGVRPLSALSSPKEVIRQFTPNWFAATMGTGILALALAQFPWQVPGLRMVAEGLWILNIVLFPGLHCALYHTLDDVFRRSKTGVWPLYSFHVFWHHPNGNGNNH